MNTLISKISKATKLSNLINKRYEIYVREQTCTDDSHTKLQPRATYSPWNTDSAFIKIYNKIKSHTWVDLYRCYNLWDIVSQTMKLPPGNYLEVGVWKGGTSAIIAEQLRRQQSEHTLFSCDTFQGVVKASNKDNYYKGGEHADCSEKSVRDLMSKLNLNKHVKLLTGIFPDATGHEIEQHKFRFCHIDVDVYQSAHDIVTWLWDKLLPGGFIVYDDYGFNACDGIRKHVDEQRDLPDRIVLYNLNGQAIIMKR